MQQACLPRPCSRNWFSVNSVTWRIFFLRFHRWAWGAAPLRPTIINSHYNAFSILLLVAWWGKRACVCLWSGSQTGVPGSTSIHSLGIQKQATSPAVLHLAQILLQISFSWEEAEWGKHWKELKSGYREWTPLGVLEGRTDTEAGSLQTPNPRALCYTHMLTTLNF